MNLQGKSIETFESSDFIKKDSQDKTSEEWRVHNLLSLEALDKETSSRITNKEININFIKEKK